MLTTNKSVITTFIFTISTLAAINASAESISGQGKCTYKPTSANIANTDGYAVMLS